MGEWATEDLGFFVRIVTQQITPAAFPNEIFAHYSLPAFDATGGPLAQEGRSIESGKFRLGQPAVLVSKLNPRKMRVQTFESAGGLRAVASTEFMVYVPRVDDLELHYLGHLLSSNRIAQRLQAVATGTTNSHVRVKPSETLRWPVRVPPLEEQRRIAKILDTIDETIQATERVIAKLELVQSGVIDRSFRRPQGVFTELGAACLGPGEYGCVAAAELRRSGWPRYVRITDLTDSGQLRKDLDMGVSPSVAQRATLHTGDIVFARSGATVGKSYLYDPSDGPCAFAGYLIRFRPDPTKALPEFVRWWTHSSSYWRWIKRTMREGAQPNINAQEYAKAALPLPSIEEQRVIVGAIARLDVSLTSERARWEKLRQLRSGVAADLLSGRVRTVAA